VSGLVSAATVAAMTIMTAPARPTREVALTVLFWLLVLPGLVWAVVRLGGWERGPLVQLFAFTPYVAGWSWLPVVLSLSTGRWTIGVVALAAAVALTAIVLPRAIPGGRGPSTGVPLHVMTSNMLFGNADPDEIVRLVREHDVAVLAVQEFTPEARKALTKAGLDDLLPYHSLADEPGASGTGFYSRFAVTGAGSRRNGAGFMQTYGVVQPPGAAPLTVESAHPIAPWAVKVNGDWRDDLAAQPKADPHGTPRILLGDFNATLDHTPLRRLIASGYRDAAAAAGKGLVPTWPFDGRKVPPVTLDHVLVDERIGVGEVSVHRIPDSDHRAVIAALTVPAHT
jgi:endonuclease/exonuclease/phosphatase (EEP) superfamily protein YafD